MCYNINFVLGAPEAEASFKSASFQLFLFFILKFRGRHLGPFSGKLQLKGILFGSSCFNLKVSYLFFTLQLSSKFAFSAIFSLSDFPSFYEMFDNVVCEPDLQTIGDDVSSTTLNGGSSHHFDDFQVTASQQHDSLSPMPSRTFESPGMKTSSNGMCAFTPLSLQPDEALTSHCDFSLPSRLGDDLNGVMLPDVLKRPAVEENSFASSKRLCGVRSAVEPRTRSAVAADVECVDAQTQTEPTTGHYFV